MMTEEFARVGKVQADVDRDLVPGAYEAMQAFSKAVNALLNLGIIPTLETAPYEPLAQGRYTLKATYRKSKQLYRKEKA